MKEKIHISIDKPCGQNFKDFKKTDSGGFCSNCQKEVIDFTSKSKAELYQFFNSNEGSVCGKFYPSQLGELTPTYQNHRSNFKLPLIAATIGFLAFTNQNEVLAQSNKSHDQHIEFNSKISQPSKGNKKDSLVTIAGKVVSIDDKSSLPGVNVVVKGTTFGAVTNIDGYYNLSIPNKPGDNIKLIISFIGLATEEVEININYDIIEMPTIEMSPEVVNLGGVFVRKWSPRGIWYKIRSLF